MLIQLLETAAQVDGCPGDEQYCHSNLISPFTAAAKMYLYSEQGSVAYTVDDFSVDFVGSV